MCKNVVIYLHLSSNFSDILHSVTGSNKNTDFEKNFLKETWYENPTHFPNLHPEICVL